MAIKENTIIRASELLDTIYPIGSVYISMQDTDPSAIFGGTWKRLKDRFLLGASDTYNAGSTGGESAVTLSTSQIPSHSHTRGSMDITGTISSLVIDDGQSYYANGAFSSWNTRNKTWVSETPGAANYAIDFVASRNWTGATSNVGGGKAHNNMPPYLVVYMWYRSA